MCSIMYNIASHDDIILDIQVMSLELYDITH
jgi:hypothetical protein